MKRHNFLGLVATGLAALLLFLGLLAQAHAQTATGSISGTVRDPAQAAVVGSAVTVTNTATGASRQTSTNNLGYYAFPLLPPATYRLEVERTGFKRFVREGIKLDVALAEIVDAALELGDLAQTVTVTSEAPPLETGAASLGHILENKRITELPLNGRNSYAFAALVPGVRPTRSFGQLPSDVRNSQYLTINGARANQNAFYVDGGVATHPGFNGPGYFPSLDMVQEFKVQTNNFSAEYSNAAGGVINLISKSGANQLHGSLFEFFRHDKLTATDFFTNKTGSAKAVFRYNQFGGTAGGPVMQPRFYSGKDRTFFFASYEGVRWINALVASGTVPALRERTGDFSETRNAAGRVIAIYDPLTMRPDPARPGRFLRSAFSGNLIPPGRIDPVARNFLNFVPPPNVPGNPVTNVGNFFSNYPVSTRRDDFSLRLDHAIATNHKIYGRYSKSSISVVPPSAYGASYTPGNPVFGDQYVRPTSAVVNYSGLLQPTLVLEVSSSLMRVTVQRIAPAARFDLLQLGLPTYFRDLQSRMIPCFPNVTVPPLRLSFSIPNTGSGNLLGANCNDYLEAFEDFHQHANLTKIRGSHALKWGGNFGVIRNSTDRYGVALPAFNFTTGFTQGPDPMSASGSGVAFASFLIGAGTGNIGSDGPIIHLLHRYYGLYFQDDWKVTRRLTVNLGIRYDYPGSPTERYNQFTNWDPGARSPLRITGLDLQGGLAFPGTGGLSRSFFLPDRNNFAPRFGFAYALGPNTVIRGGAGIFFAPITGGAFLPQVVPISGFLSQTAWVGTVDNLTPNNPLSNPFPLGFERATGSRLGAATLLGQDVLGMDRQRKTSYAEQWSFDVQHKLPGSVLVDVAYAGSRGIKLFGNLAYNQLPNQVFSLRDELRRLAPNPFLGKVATGDLSGPQVQFRQLLRPYPQFDSVTVNSSYGASTYHSLQAKVERRFSRGFSLLASYTFSKLIDDVGASIEGTAGETVGAGAGRSLQNYGNRRLERSVGAYDTPHAFAVNSVWELPAGRGKRFLSGRGWLPAVLAGWQLNGIAIFQSGTPLGLNSRTTETTVFSFGDVLRPDWNGKNPYVSGKISQRLDRYFDPSAFSPPPPYTYGNLARLLSWLRAPGVASMDLSLFKNIRVRERVKLQFRAECFNALNHPEFGVPAIGIGNASAGVISNQANQPRDVQMALKLVF